MVFPVYDQFKNVEYPKEKIHQSHVVLLSYVPDTIYFSNVKSSINAMDTVFLACVQRLCRCLHAFPIMHLK